MSSPRRPRRRRRCPTPEVLKDLDRGQGERLQRDFLTGQLKATLQALEKSRVPLVPAADDEAPSETPQPAELHPVPPEVGAQLSADFFDKAMAKAMSRVEATGAR